LPVSSYECDANEVGRTAQDIAGSEDDDLFVCLQITGRSTNFQADRQAVNESGSFFLLDPRRPFTGVQHTRGKLITFKVPRALLDSRLGNAAAYASRNLAADKPVAGLAYGFLSMIPDRMETLDRVSAAKLAEQVVDMVTLALSVDGEFSNGGLSSARASALMRLKSAAEIRLSDPTLKPAAVAAAAGVSVRYANALLAQEGTSVERYIQERRLARCRRVLADPAHAHRTIGEIAFSWGFSDLSHFGRRFKAEFGLSPGEYRRRAAKADRASGLRPAGILQTGVLQPASD
jgi:AraC-like DNA-binding protein